MVAGGPNDGLDIPVREIKLQTRVCRDTYGAAMKVIGNADRQETGRWLNNRVENSHQPFLRQERAMLRFRSTKTLQKFASIHSSINNHFNLERHLTDRSTFKLNRTAVLEAWRQLAA
jgi:putative transposase